MALGFLPFLLIEWPDHLRRRLHSHLRNLHWAPSQSFIGGLTDWGGGLAERKGNRRWIGEERRWIQIWKCIYVKELWSKFVYLYLVFRFLSIFVFVFCTCDEEKPANREQQMHVAEQVQRIHHTVVSGVGEASTRGGIVKPRAGFVLILRLYLFLCSQLYFYNWSWIGQANGEKQNRT